MKNSAIVVVTGGGITGRPDDIKPIERRDEPTGGKI
jgi:hypothetical protein